MFTMEEMLSKRNQRDAFNHFSMKKNGRGVDGMQISELEDYWKINHEQIEADLLTGNYQLGIVKSYEMIDGRGKRRVICSLNAIDRFVARLLAQKLRRYMEPEFCENSFAYQEGKGVAAAVEKACQYINEGYMIVTEMDIESYFDKIPLDRMMLLIEQRIEDKAVRQLIRRFLYCKVAFDSRIEDKTIGIIQGNPASPVLSNFYLNELDHYMEEKGYCWVRFADNINIYTKTQEEAADIYNAISQFLGTEAGLNLNQKKSGIFNACERRFLGYEFYKVSGHIRAKQHRYQPQNVYKQWHPCVVEKVNREYHIVQNGILNKEDYALLFENEDEKHHIPVEVTNQLNIYGEVTIHSNVLRTISKRKIRLALIDEHGNLMGYYLPTDYGRAAQALLKQCTLYNDTDRRMKTALQMEIAGLHNMRSNLRNYLKRGKKELESYIQELGQMIQELRVSENVDQLMLIEARARQKYYLAFNHILKPGTLHFDKRTKRPPQDPLNAMISFGNTLLYNHFLQIIWNTSLDSRIGIVHATNKRANSLNLDFADIFKPVIVDRIIFSINNRGQIKSDLHFEKKDDKGVYLNKEGKRIFIEEFETKLDSKVVYKNKSLTYKQLMEQEVWQFQRYVLKDMPYKPYKYY